MISDYEISSFIINDNYESTTQFYPMKHFASLFFSYWIYKYFCIIHFLYTFSQVMQTIVEWNTCINYIYQLYLHKYFNQGLLRPIKMQIEINKRCNVNGKMQHLLIAHEASLSLGHIKDTIDYMKCLLLLHILMIIRSLFIYFPINLLYV